jgi:hypothetical protein
MILVVAAESGFSAECIDPLTQSQSQKKETTRAFLTIPPDSFGWTRLRIIWQVIVPSHNLLITSSWISFFQRFPPLGGKVATDDGFVIPQNGRPWIICRLRRLIPPP